jgi:hypothetical protein
MKRHQVRGEPDEDNRDQSIGGGDLDTNDLKPDRSG